MDLKTIPWKKNGLHLRNPHQKGRINISPCFLYLSRYIYTYIIISNFSLILNLLIRGVAALSKQSPIKTPDSTSISKSITRNIRYEKEFVHILQTSELRSQLANAFGTEADEKRSSAPTLRWKSSWSYPCQENSTTNSEWTSIPRIICSLQAHDSNSKHTQCLGRPGSEYLLNQYDWWCKDWCFQYEHSQPNQTVGYAADKVNEFSPLMLMNM